jgi:hypothetical protein
VAHRIDRGFHGGHERGDTTVFGLAVFHRSFDGKTWFGDGTHAEGCAWRRQCVGGSAKFGGFVDSFTERAEAGIDDTEVAIDDLLEHRRVVSKRNMQLLKYTGINSGRRTHVANRRSHGPTSGLTRQQLDKHLLIP